MNHLLLTACLFLAALFSRDCLNAQHTFLISRPGNESPTARGKSLSSRWCSLKKDSPFPQIKKCAAREEMGSWRQIFSLWHKNDDNSVTITTFNPNLKVHFCPWKSSTQEPKCARNAAKHFANMISLNPYNWRFRYLPSEHRAAKTKVWGGPGCIAQGLPRSKQEVNRWSRKASAGL